MRSFLSLAVLAISTLMLSGCATDPDLHRHSQLFVITISNDVAKVKEVLASDMKNEPMTKEEMLASAINFSAYEVATQIIQSGVNINHKTSPMNDEKYRKSKFPYHVGIRNGTYWGVCHTVKMADLLLQSGININQRNPYGFTPIMRGAKLQKLRGEKTEISLYDYLKSKGANTELTNLGRTTLDWAQSMDYQQVEIQQYAKEENDRTVAYVKQQQAEKERVERNKQERVAQKDPGFQWGKFAAISTGVAIGGGMLDSSSKATLLVGAALDSQAGVEGASNTQGQMNNVQQNYESKRRITEQTQQARNSRATNSTVGSSASRNTNVALAPSQAVGSGAAPSASSEVVKLLPTVSSRAWSDCKEQALEMDQKHRKANCTPGTLCEYGDGIRVSCVDSTGGAEPPTMANQTRSCADLKRRAVSGGGQLVREFGCGCFNPNGTGYMDSYNNVTCQFVAIIQKNPDAQSRRGSAVSK